MKFVGGKAVAAFALLLQLHAHASFTDRVTAEELYESLVELQKDGKLPAGCKYQFELTGGKTLTVKITQAKKVYTGLSWDRLRSSM